jgi:hypothetical protein
MEHIQPPVLNAYTLQTGQKIQAIDIEASGIMEIAESETVLRRFLQETFLIGFTDTNSFIEITAGRHEQKYSLKYNHGNFRKTVADLDFQRAAEILYCYFEGAMSSVPEFALSAAPGRRWLERLFLAVAASGILAFFVMGVLNLATALSIPASKISAVGGFLMTCGLILFWITRGEITVGKGSIKFGARPFLYLFILLCCLVFMVLCVVWLFM